MRRKRSVPPNYELRPPSEGALGIEDDNKDILFPDKDETDEELTLSDEILLIEVGEKETKANIRKIINDENSIEEVDKSIIDKILNFEAVFEEKSNDQLEEIDPAKEKERIEKLEKEGKIIKGANDAVIIEKEGSLD